MERSTLQVSNLRLRLRAAKSGDLLELVGILAEITEMADHAVQLIPDLIAAMKRGVYFPTTSLVPIIISFKSAGLLNAACEQEDGNWPLSTFERCELVQAGFLQFQDALVDELFQLFESDVEPRRSVIVDALAQSGTASTLETLRVIEYRTAERIRELEANLEANDLVEEASAQLMRGEYLPARRTFLEKVRRAIPLVGTRPDPVAAVERGEVVGEPSEPVMAHVLFLDLVGYSKLPMDKQKEVHNQLTEIVDALPTVQRYRGQRRLNILPTGDGMALAFFGGVKPHVNTAIELHRALLGNEQVRLRTGLHTGPVDPVIDINGQQNVSGSGINLAQRVMDCGDAGHILLSNAVAEILFGLGGCEDLLQDLDTVEVKHGYRIHLFNMLGEGFGNDSKPSKLASVTEATSDAKSRAPGSVEEAYPSKDIVRAWFDDAINPLIANLKIEEDLLGEETWTWDQKANKFQRLDCIYQPSSFGANQEDFLDRYPNIVEVLKQHDESIANLNAEGETLFKEMIQSSFLRDTFANASTSEALDKLKGENPELFADPDPAKVLAQVVGHRSEETLIAWLAELSINRRSLDSSWRIAPFWNENKQLFVELVPRCAAHARVLRARELLLQVIQEVITILKVTRKELSERHGVPVEGTPRNLDDAYSSFASPFRWS